MQKQICAAPLHFHILIVAFFICNRWNSASYSLHQNRQSKKTMQSKEKIRLLNFLQYGYVIVTSPLCIAKKSAYQISYYLHYLKEVALQKGWYNIQMDSKQADWLNWIVLYYTHCFVLLHCIDLMWFGTFFRTRNVSIHGCKALHVKTVLKRKIHKTVYTMWTCD